MIDKLVRDQSNERRTPQDAEERSRIIKIAANIISEDIRSKYYDNSAYKAPSSILDNVTEDVSPSLQIFLDTVIKKNKRLDKQAAKLKWDRRVTMIAHVIISSVRPRSFLSSILLGLSAMMHKKHRSKNLIDCLSYLRLCLPYHETMLFEASVVNDPENYNLSNVSYVKFIFDNADHNTNTIDGLNTFHVMGEIMCVTPSSAVSSDKMIEKLK